MGLGLQGGALTSAISVNEVLADSVNEARSPPELGSAPAERDGCFCVVTRARRVLHGPTFVGLGLAMVMAEAGAGFRDGCYCTWHARVRGA